jgi:predicted Zn-dependent peptidase
MGLYLLNNILGGPGMNSLLNLSLREKHGLVYNVESSYQPFTDTGMWTVYFGCDPENANRCEQLVYRELQKLRDFPKVDSMNEIRTHIDNLTAEKLQEIAREIFDPEKLTILKYE